VSRRAALGLGAALVLASTAGRAAGQVVPPAPPGAAAAPAAAPEAAGAAPATALEAWLARPGRVVVERARALPPIALASGARLVLEAVVAFEPVREHERALGLRVRLEGGERAGRAALAYLDPFEIDELARTLAALPGLERLEREGGARAEIRHVGRDGFGVVARLAPGAASPVRFLRFPGDPPLELPASDATLAELRRQLDAARGLLFEVHSGDSRAR
jgi:hypothetical protein